MIPQSKFLPGQMNGPVINSVMAGLESRLGDSGTIIDYLYNLSILTAQEDELESIGCIIGYPRPLVPEGFNQENILVLGTLPLTTDELDGLATIDSEVGGRFASVRKSDSDYMSLGLYRRFLDKVAYIKRYGITIYSVDQIAKLVSNTYTITWSADHDIILHFGNDIGYKNIWILTSLFYRLSTNPQVIITAGGD